MKNFTKEKFLELLSKTDFPDCMTFTSLSKAYQDFIFKFSELKWLIYFANVKN